MLIAIHLSGAINCNSFSTKAFKCYIADDDALLNVFARISKTAQLIAKVNHAMNHSSSHVLNFNLIDKKAIYLHSWIEHLGIVEIAKSDREML